MAVTIITAEARSAAAKTPYITTVKASFGAQNDTLVLNHAADPSHARVVTILSADSPMKMVAIPSADWEISFTTDATTTVKNLKAGAQANITIVISVAP
jgi:hypothetical protein